MTQINITIEIDENTKVDLVNQAAETEAIAYWCDSFAGFHRKEMEIDGFTHNYCYSFEVFADGWHTIDTNTIGNGIERILNGEVKINDRLYSYIRESAIDGNEFDSDALDCIIQAGLFGDIIYG